MQNVEMVYVEIVNIKTNEVVKSMGPMSKSKADKIEGGVMINMNHEEYFTRQRPEKDDTDG